MAESEPTGRRVWDVVLDPATGGGCSTLDLLKRIPYANAAEPSPHASPAVRAEMESIARARRVDIELKQRHASTKGHVANMTTLGERLNRPKQVYVPGTPVDRRLKAGRLVRTDGRDELHHLSSSRSAPSLPTTKPAASVTGSADTLDQEVLQRQQPQRAKACAQPQEDPRTTQLRDQRQQLEHELLYVTQKLVRKYSKQLFPRPGPTESPNRTKQLAEKWAHSETLGEREKYELYMGSRFTTQQQRDFYRRELEPREPENDRHKRETAHTKYGDALARSKNSLRANF